MPRGIPNPPPEEDEDAELGRLIAEEEAAKAESEAALAAQAEDRAEQQRTAEAKEVLLGQAEALGLKVHHRWSVETLAKRVLEAQEAAKQAEEAKFTEAPKVWVYLNRAAYPVEDKKHMAGETIEVTPEIAEKWYEAGVARPGKAPV
jgi:hypothetical protein